MLPLYDENPTKINPIVTIVLMAGCIIVSLWQFFSPPEFENIISYQLGVIPGVLFETHVMEDPWLTPTGTVFSSMFAHGGWMHLIGNMAFLWVFGNNIEDAMGHGKFILFYFLCGVVAVLAYAIPNADSAVPLIGASGAISGVLGAYLLLYPKVKVVIGIPIWTYIFMYPIEMRAFWALSGWIAMQLILPLVIEEEPEGGVAYAAHIGGFVAGMVLIPFFKHRDVKLHIPFVK